MPLLRHSTTLSSLPGTTLKATRDGQVPTPPPGSILSRLGRRRLSANVPGPVNTLDGRPSMTNARSVPKPSISSSYGASTGVSSRPQNRAKQTTYEGRGSKRLRLNPTFSVDLRGPSQDDVKYVETIDKSTTSNDGPPSQKKDNKMQIRQDEYRNAMPSVGSSRGPRRRAGRRRSPGAAGRQNSDRSEHSPRPPAFMSPDELQVSSPPPIQSDLFPPKVAKVLKSPRPAKNHLSASSLPFGAANHRRKFVQGEGISDDELAIEGSKKTKRKSLQKTPGSAERRSTRLSPKLGCRRAISGGHVYQPKNGFELVQGETEALWTSVTTDGKPAGFPWLKFDIAKSVHKIVHACASRIILIHRSNAAGAPSKLVIEFQDEEQSDRFILEARKFKIIKVEERNNGYLNNVLETDLRNARETGAANLHDESAESDPKEVPRTPVHGDATADSRATPKLRVIDQMASIPGESSVLQQRSSPLSDPSSIVRPRRTTRQSAFDRLRFDRDSSPPRWSLNNTDWEKDWDRELVYPSTGRNRATVHREDIYRLDEGAFLNDSLIFCYLRYLQLEMERERPEVAKRIYFMNTYFFEILKKTKEKGTLINYEGVKSWTSKVDIFSFDYIVVPVNEEAHWYLAIICNPRLLIENDSDTDDEVVFYDALETPSSPPRTRSRGEAGTQDTPPLPTTKGSGPKRKPNSQEIRVITLDSLGGSHSKTCRMLRRYLVEEAKFRKNLDPMEIGMKIGMTAKNIPSQENYCDCGVFLLGYVQRFLEDPDGFVATILRRGEPEWTVNPSELRGQIRDTIFGLHNQYREELAVQRQMKKRKRALERTQGSPVVASPGTTASEARLQSQASATPSQRGSPDKPALDSDAACERADGSRSVEPDSVQPRAEDGAILRLRPQSLVPDEGDDVGSLPQPGAQKLTVSDTDERTTQAKDQEGGADIRPSVEHDDEPSSPSHGTTPSPDPLSSLGRSGQVDEIIRSPSASEPPDTCKSEAMPSLPTTPKRSMEITDEAPHGEPMFIDTIPSSPVLCERHVSPVLGETTLGESSPRKRSAKVIALGGDGLSPRAAKGVEESATKSRFFPGSDDGARAVFVPQKRSRQSSGSYSETWDAAVRAGKKGRRSSDAIDLTESK